ncbi:FadR/GntR family transcriptional regulator [Catenulispora acidiphila]|uniref:FadR/GntR family transcriptional regulator n=1 Tax=Catenulispora acidiphila TaxID=304895 RepID=UPI0005A2FD82|nr:GntR family transcriptional regulator [Catenulispora acidiphila]
MNTFAPVVRSSVAAAVFEQILGRILDGSLDPGSALPSERALTLELGVTRQVVREALQRLDQLGLVEIRHGGGTRVLDYRDAAGLDLLPRLFRRADGSLDAEVVRSVMEMRQAVGADAAALCALRLADTAGLRRAVAEGAGRGHDLESVFWDLIVDGSQNICYRLSLNALRQAYAPAAALVADVLADEITAVRRYEDVIAAIEARDPERARAAAGELLGLGTAAITAFLEGR